MMSQIPNESLQPYMRLFHAFMNTLILFWKPQNKTLPTDLFHLI